MNHFFRKFTRDRAGFNHYETPHFTPDIDISKLFRYGEVIRDMIGMRRLDYALEHHTTVEKLRTHTLAIIFNLLIFILIYSDFH